MTLSCNYHQDIGDFESILAKKLNSAMNKKEKTEMKNTSDIQREVLNWIQAWVNTRYYPCFVDFKHVMGGMGEIASTHMWFLPCGHIEIHWDEVESADETIRAITNHITKVHEEYHELVKKNLNRSVPAIEKVIFNDPATIIFWKDGTKTVVKCSEDDEFNPEVGMAMAISKKALGNKGNYCNEIKKWVEPFYEEVNEWFELSLSECFKKAAENLSNIAKNWNHSKVEKSESLKSVEDGKAIGEGLEAGMKESNDAPEAKEESEVHRLCINCKFELRSGNEEPCYSCRIPQEHNNWTPRD